jgi:thiol-disulfide isomerase/thioredoxin
MIAALLVAACAAPPEPTRDVAAAPKPAEPAKPAFIAAPAGDVAEIVRAEAATPGLVVYVGATWCEPCAAFHEAVQAGRFDRELAGARFLEFDLDRDRERLAAAGYSSRLIPLFALPGPDGRASERRIEGGIKGPRAADHVLGRLVPLLAGADAKSP